MPLRLNFGHTSHLEIGLRQGPHQFIAAVIEPLVRAFGHPRKAVSSEQWQRNRGVHIGHHTIGQGLRIDLAPTDGFSRSGTAQASGIRPGIGALQKVIVALLINPHHFLDLRLGLKHEILRATSPQNENRRRAPGSLGIIDDRGALIDIAVDIKLEGLISQGHGGHVHPDGTVARAAGENRDAITVGCRQH